MSEPDYLADIGAELFRAGITPSLPVRQAPLLVDGQNILFHEDSVQSLPGFSLLFSGKLEASEILGMCAVSVAGVPTLIFGTASTLYRYRESDGVTIVGSGFSTPATGRWIIEPYGEWVLATNNFDPPQIYKGSSFTAIGGIGDGDTAFARAKILARNRAFLFAINTDYDSRGVHWSDDDNPEQWDPVVNAEAGFIPVREADSELIAAIELDQDLIVFSKYSMHRINYIQSPNFFGSSKIIDGFGAVGPRAVTRAIAKMYGFGFDFIWESNGVAAVPISMPVITRFIYTDINKDALHKIEAFHAASRTIVGWFYPSAGSEVNDRLVAYNYAKPSWTIWGFGQSSVEDNQVFPYLLLGNTTGDVSVLDFNADVAALIGTPLTFSAVYTMGGGFGRDFGRWFGGRVTGPG